MSDVRDSITAELRQNEDGVNSKSDQVIFLSGSSGAGKTTAVKTLSDSFVIENRLLSDKNSSSVGLDCGKLKLSNNNDLLLYATYNQESSETVLNALQDEVIGVVLLIDNRRKDPLRDLETLLIKLSAENTQPINVVTGVTHFDSSRTPAISDYHSFILNQGLFPDQNPPIFSVDARNYRDMCFLIEALLYTLDPSMPELLSEEKNLLS